MNATTSPETTALAVAPRQSFDLSPRDFDEAWRMAEYLSDSDMVPKDFKGKPANCLVAIQWGGELGLKTMQAIQNIAVINGRPSLWGDVMLALVRASPLCEYVVETVTDQGATCKVKRRGEPEQSREFTAADATAAGLINKDGPWKQYRKRMLQMRARAWALRDVFTDVLKGLNMAAEAMDMPPEKFMGAADVVGAPPPPPAPAATYPAADFDKNLPAWAKAVGTNKKTRDELLAMVQTKGALTEDQLQRLDAAIEKAKPIDASTTGEVVMTYAQVAERLNKADDADKLAVAGILIATVADEAQRKELTELYDRRADELNPA